MKIWAVANQKGGVGKTTTAVTLGGLLVARGSPTLLIDLDPHGSLTTYFGHDPDSVTTGVYSLFRQAAGGGVDPGVPVLQTRFEGLDILAASTALATLDRQLGAREGMGLVLKRALMSMENRYEYVLIDCPPMLGVLMINALAACQHLLIPVQTEFLAIKGLERMLHTLEMIQRTRRMELPYTILPTMFDRKARVSVQSLRKLRETCPDSLWEGVIPSDTRFREASTAGQPLSLMLPESRGARAYDALLGFLEYGSRMDKSDAEWMHE